MIDALVSTVAWSAVAGYAAWRADLRAQQYIAGLEVREAIKNPVAPDVKKELSRRDVQLPDDLQAWVNTWGDQFARDDAKMSIVDKFLELHTGDSDETWQTVRKAIGIGELP